MSVLDRHIAFIEALRRAGLPVSLSEGLDAVRAIENLGVEDRSLLRETYAATLIKRRPHRRSFDELFDLYFPPVVGQSVGWDPAELLDAGEERDASAARDGEFAPVGTVDTPEALEQFREQLAAAMAMGDPDLMQAMAREAVQRFGAIQGRGPGETRWSTYNVMNRVAPGELVQRALQAMGEELDNDHGLRGLVEAQARVFENYVEADVRRRAAEVRGPDHVARHSVGPSIDQLDFLSARRADLDLLRREIAPLARKLATRLHRQQAKRRRGPLDFRRTVRASLSSGGVPLDTHYRPRRPGRPDLVVLCDVSGSVSSFANFTMMLVFALREQFNKVRAFTFVDDVVEVTDRFVPGADPVEVLAGLAESAEYAALWGRTNYGRAFRRFAESWPDALGPRTHLLILGDARSNYADLALGDLKDLVDAARKAWWLNPEPVSSWDTGDSAAGEYGRLVPMVECRNLTQLSAFVDDLV